MLPATAVRLSVSVLLPESETLFFLQEVVDSNKSEIVIRNVYFTGFIIIVSPQTVSS